MNTKTSATFRHFIATNTCLLIKKYNGRSERRRSIYNRRVPTKQRLESWKRRRRARTRLLKQIWICVCSVCVICEMFSSDKIKKGIEEVHCYRSFKIKPPRTPTLSRAKHQRRESLILNKQSLMRWSGNFGLDGSLVGCPECYT